MQTTLSSAISGVDVVAVLCRDAVCTLQEPRRRQRVASDLLIVVVVVVVVDEADEIGTCLLQRRRGRGKRGRERESLYSQRRRIHSFAVRSDRILLGAHLGSMTMASSRCRLCRRRDGCKKRLKSAAKTESLIRRFRLRALARRGRQKRPQTRTGRGPHTRSRFRVARLDRSDPSARAGFIVRVEASLRQSRLPLRAGASHLRA